MIHGTAYTKTTSSRLLLLHHSRRDLLTKSASFALVSQVGSSEAALLTKLGMKQFELGPETEQKPEAAPGEVPEDNVAPTLATH